MDWRYVKPLRTEDSIRRFEELAGFSFPEDFKRCVRAHNGGRPPRCAFDTDRSRGRALKTLLSFNAEDWESVWRVQSLSEEDLAGQYVAIGLDNFGNLICYDKCSRGVVFWDHEKRAAERIADSFDGFLGALYD